VFRSFMEIFFILLLVYSRHKQAACDKFQSYKNQVSAKSTFSPPEILLLTCVQKMPCSKFATDADYPYVLSRFYSAPPKQERQTRNRPTPLPVTSSDNHQLHRYKTLHTPNYGRCHPIHNKLNTAKMTPFISLAFMINYALHCPNNDQYYIRL
jgi:hypothetical protein